MLNFRKIFFNLIVLIVLLCNSIIISFGQVNNLCKENLVKNPSFEEYNEQTMESLYWVNAKSKHTDWITVPDGEMYGYVNGENTFYQNVIITDTSKVLEFSFFAGKHPTDYEQIIFIKEFVDGEIIQNIVYTITNVVDENHDLGNKITIPITLKSNNSIIQIGGKSNRGWVKVDMMCLIKLEPKILEETEEPKIQLFLSLIMK